MGEIGELNRDDMPTFKRNEFLKPLNIIIIYNLYAIFRQPRHGHVKCATDWLYSSIHVYITKGILSYDWGYNDDGFDGVMFGEKT